jgi:BMFP domain-containing protein YqiC
MIRTSEQTDELMVALAKAQAKFGAAAKTNINPMFKSKYADISSIIDATLEHLNAEGIVLMQHPSLEYKEVHTNGEVSTLAFVTMTTRIQFKGQWIESDLSAPAMMRDRFDAQSVGSACTYLSRYQMQSILVVPREDDDAVRAVGGGTREEAQAVGQAKIDALKASKAQQKPSGDLSLFYVWYEESKRAEITGAESLLKLNKDLLRQYWDSNAKALLVTGEQLEDLKYKLETRNVPFSALKAPARA